jgi:hypothetical protein
VELLVLTKRHLAVASAILLSSVALGAMDGDRFIRCHASPDRLSAAVAGLFEPA